MKLPNTIEKIGIFRALQLGDLLCCTPAFRALRYAFLNAEITLIGLPWAASLVDRYPSYFDRFLHFPGYTGLPEQPDDPYAFDNFQKIMRKEKFDLLLQMQGNGTIVNEMMNSFQPKYLAGFHNKESDMGSELFIEYPNDVYEAERHLRLIDHLGIERQGDELEFPLTPKDYEDYNDLQLELEPKSYVIVHPGSRGAWRQWPPENFAFLANYCSSKGMKIVVTGTKDEEPITSELIRHLEEPCIDLTGNTSLGALGVLLSNSFLLIANCTGISHMAVALKIPSIIISMDGEPHRWGAPNKALHRTFDWTQNQNKTDVFYEMVNLFHELEFQAVHFSNR